MSSHSVRALDLLPPANEFCGKVMFLSVCHSVHGGGGDSKHASQVTSLDGVCIQVVGQMPPSPRHMGYYRIWSTSEWYASYWNAILLPPATKLGQGYIFTGICDSVHRGVCLSACWDTTPLPRPGRHPHLGPGRHTPLTRQATPRIRHAPPSDQAGSPPRAEHTGRYGQRACGMHPTGMQFCLEIKLANPNGDNVTVPLGLWMFERPGELRLNHSWLKFRTIYLSLFDCTQFVQEISSNM